MIKMKLRKARSVEVPWMLEKITKGSVLDVGSCGSPYIEELICNNHDVTRVDIRQFKCLYGSKYIKGNIMDLDPKHLSLFDNVTLISTLEHIGLNGYDLKRVKEPFELQVECFRHCLKFVKVGGRLFCTIPYGIFQDGGWFFVYDKKMLDLLLYNIKPNSLDFFTYNEVKKIYQKCQQDEVPPKGRINRRACSVACMDILKT